MLGSQMKQKDFILDVRVLINNSKTINLEMQVIDEHNWPERSLVYLCRIFDNINKDESYQNLKPAHHISIIGFDLSTNDSEFYATYQLLNVKNHKKYTDKFTLSVLSLSCIDKATVKDKASHLDEWAAMYRAKTWEDLRMLAQKNSDIDNAVTTMFSLSNESLIKEQIWTREEYYRLHRSIDSLIEDQKKALADKDKALADQKKELAEKDKQIAELQAQLASLTQK